MITTNTKIMNPRLSLEVHLSYTVRQFSISIIPQNSDAVDKHVKPKIQDEKTVIKILEGINESAFVKLLIHNKCSIPTIG